jgi:hypothetical protein
MTGIGRKIDFFWTLFALTVSLVIITTGGAAWLAVQSLAVELLEPPFQYVDITYPEDNNYCPGDRVRFTTTIEVLRAPVLSVRIRSIWNTELKRTVVADTTPDYFAWLEKDVIITNDFFYELPYNLPVGSYELRSIIAGLNRGTAGVAIPFFIKDDC